MASSDTAAPLPPELAQIQAEAQAIEPPPVDPVTGEPPAPALPVDYLSEAKGVVDVAAELLGMIGPRTVAALNQERREKVATAAAGLMEKYGLTLGDVFSKWGAEINFLFALAVVGPPVARAIKDDRAEVAAQEKAAQITKRNPDPQPERAAADPYNRAFAE